MTSPDEFETHVRGFSVDGITHSYDDVAQLFYESTRVNTSINLIPTGHYFTGRLDIYLTSQEQPLRVRVTREAFAVRINKSHYMKVAQGYQILAERTFERRYRFYSNQISQSGRFTYDGAEFHLNGLVRKDNREMRIQQAILSVEPFRLVLYLPGRNLISAWLNATWRKISVDTRLDGDIFPALLTQMYGLSIR